MEIRRFITTFCVIFAALTFASMLLCALVPIDGEGEIFTDTLRLHVVANSDSDADQALKLAVRDAVVGEMSELCGKVTCASVEDAVELVRANEARFLDVAESVIAESGFDYPVTLEIGREVFPTRDYESVRLPAGEYTAVRVAIGDGDGRNWWCVLYPALCVDAAEPKQKLVEAGFTSSQIRLLTDSESPRYVLRFRLLEWLGKVLYGESRYE